MGPVQPCPARRSFAVLSTVVTVTLIALSDACAASQITSRSRSARSEPRSAGAKLSRDTWRPGPGWKLSWSDEFAGSSLHTNNWVFDLGADGWGNRELQTYTSSPDNVSVRDGDLILRAIEARGKYTSARLKTLGKKSWQYGKIAARIRLPYGQGIWPAFWMLGDNVNSIGWPKCGEIDIMEMIGGGENRDDSSYGTLHWGDSAGKHLEKGSGPKELPDPAIFHDDYHVFEVEWTRREINWRRDGREYLRINIDVKAHPDMQAFHRPFFILLNLAIGGNWPGNPNSSTVFPQEMRVDWVRVYQRG